MDSLNAFDNNWDYWNMKKAQGEIRKKEWIYKMRNKESDKILASIEAGTPIKLNIVLAK